MKESVEQIKSIPLKPCPSCENKDVKLITGVNEKGHSQFDRVVCKFCGVAGPMFDGHPLDAISGWNSMPRRVQEIGMQ